MSAAYTPRMDETSKEQPQDPQPDPNEVVAETIRKALKDQGLYVATLVTKPNPQGPMIPLWVMSTSNRGLMQFLAECARTYIAAEEKDHGKGKIILPGNT